MSTYEKRWIQAHRYAVRCGDQAYDLARPGKESEMYYKTYTREMSAFDALEALRQNAPNQAAVDEMAAALLKSAPAPEMPHHCPECDGQISHGHFCPKCDYQLEA